MNTPTATNKTTVTGNERVRFCLDEEADTFIDVRIENGKLIVRASDALLIRPSSANSVSIAVESL